MRALILTAGLGTRLRPLTYLRAKAAVPVNGQALVRRVIGWLVAQGVGDLILNLHHHPATIAGAVGDGADLGARVRYSWENPVLGSAGGPRRALPLLSPGGDPFLLVNGDTLTDLALRDLLDTHARAGAAVTMALIPNPRPDKYGGVLVEDGYVTGFTRAGQSASNFHFIGVQAAQAAAFAAVAEGVPAESVNQLYPALMARDPHAIAAHVCDAAFQDIGTPHDYLETCLALADVEGADLVGLRSRIAPSAHLSGTVVWDDVVIGHRARLESCVVCDGAGVPEGSTFERCALVPAAGRKPAADEYIAGGLLVRSI